MRKMRNTEIYSPTTPYRAAIWEYRWYRNMRNIDDMIREIQKYLAKEIYSLTTSYRPEIWKDRNMEVDRNTDDTKKLAF